MIEAVATVPAYARPLEGPFGDGVRPGVQEALRHFLAEIEAGGPVAAPDVYSVARPRRDAGRAQPRVAAQRLPDRRPGRLAAVRRRRRRAGLEPDTLYLLAESIFAYIDVLSAESAEGYALEQSAAASEAELRRRRLVRMLVRDPPADPEAVEAAADDAGWPLPRSLAALAIGGDQRDGRRLAAAARRDQRDDRRASPARSSPTPTGPGSARRSSGRSTGAGASAGLGHDRRLDPGPDQLRPRRGRRWRWPDSRRRWWRRASAPASCCCDSDPRLAAELAADRLAPLRELSAGSRARLTETLQRVAGRAGPAGPGGRSGSASIRRPRATGSAGCGSCSATRSTTPTSASGSSWRCGCRPADE